MFLSLWPLREGGSRESPKEEKRSKKPVSWLRERHGSRTPENERRRYLKTVPLSVVYEIGQSKVMMFVVAGVAWWSSLGGHGMATAIHHSPSGENSAFPPSSRRPSPSPSQTSISPACLQHPFPSATAWPNRTRRGRATTGGMVVLFCIQSSVQMHVLRG
jgi:hypothetical protein